MSKKNKQHQRLEEETLVENKYNLKFSDLTKLKIVDTKSFEKIAWRNSSINAWCLSCGVTANPRDPYGTFDEDFWYGVYDNGETKAYCTSYGGMCGYTFEEFYSDIDENPAIAVIDKVLHSRILEIFNKLIDDGIMVKE